MSETPGDERDAYAAAVDDEGRLHDDPADVQGEGGAEGDLPPLRDDGPGAVPDEEDSPRD